MFAASFLGTLRHARTKATGELRKRRYDDADAQAWHVVDDALDAVCDLVELCLHGVPLPATEGSVSQQTDEAIATILDRRFERGPSDTAGAPQHTTAVAIDPADPAIDRIETIAETVIVPLSTAGPRAANWYVLFDRLATHTVAVTTECRQLAGRQRIDGATDLAAAWEGVADLLSDLATFIAFARRAAAWTNDPDRETIDRSEAAFSAARALTDETTTTI